MAYHRSQSPWWDYVNNFDPVGLGVDHTFTRPGRAFFAPNPLWGRPRNCAGWRERMAAREEFQRNALRHGHGPAGGCAHPCSQAPGAAEAGAASGQPGACAGNACNAGRRCREGQPGYGRRRACPGRYEAQNYRQDSSPLDNLFDILRVITGDPVADAIRSAFEPDGEATSGGDTAAHQSAGATTASNGAPAAASAPAGRRGSMNASVEDAPEDGDVTGAATGSAEKEVNESTRSEAAGRGLDRKDQSKQPENETDGNGVDSPASPAANHSAAETTKDTEAGADADADAAEAVDEQAFTPPLDLFDTESAWVLHLAVPGAQKGDVSVDWDAERGMLTVAGVVHRPGDESFVQSLARAERRVGLFRRTLPLPPSDELLPQSHSAEHGDRLEVDGEAISARMDNGLLIVTVPKAEREWTEIRSVDVL